MDLLFEVAISGMMATFGAYGIVQLVFRWAKRHQLLALPNERSSHTRPTPSSGGIAIVLMSLGGWLHFSLAHGLVSKTQMFLISGSLLIAVVSWYDDLYKLSNRLRFTVHSVAALLALGSVGWWQTLDLPFLQPLSLGWLGLPLAFFWIVALTNAYNFMDGIDGLAGSQAVVAGIGWAFLGWWSEQPLILSLGMMLAASSFGFLQHNWPPARIFMGDVGSAFLGYNFAILTLMGTTQRSGLLLTGGLLLWPFIFDTAFTLLRRWRLGENIFTAHRSHLYQRLVLAGYPHRTVTITYLFLALVGTLLGIAWGFGADGIGAAIVLVLPMLAGGLWLFVTKEENKQLLRQFKSTHLTLPETSLQQEQPFSSSKS